MSEATNQKVFVQNENDVVELLGDEKQAFLFVAAEAHKDFLDWVTEKEAKIAARESALAKLAALGLTEEEIAAL